MKRSKIILFGNFGTLNWGNEGTLEATIQNVREWSSERSLICVCTEPDEVKKRYSIDVFPVRAPYTRFFKDTNNLVIKALRKLFLAPPVTVLHLIRGAILMMSSTTMIIPGTGLLNDFGTGPLGIPYLIFKWCLLARIFGVKLVFLSNGAGPLREKLSRVFIVHALRLADYRSYRSEEDRIYVKEIGVDTENDHVLPDLAFSLKNKIFDQETNGETSRIVGLGIMDYYGEYGISKGHELVHENYINTMYQFVEYCLEKQFKIRMLIGDSTYDTSVKREFLKLIRDRVDGQDLNNVLDSEVKSLDDLLMDLSRSEIIVSPRFHNIIYGMMLGKPVLSLSYHNKFESLMKSSDLSDYALNLDDMDINLLKDTFESLYEKREDVSEKACKIKKDYRDEIIARYASLVRDGIIY
jgi:polysaccharide pyruvyl transferase WcaK-like protein